MFAVIRLRGSTNLQSGMEDTLRMMRLKHANACTILPETPDVKGMLHRTKDAITWGEISQEALTKMLEKRLRTREDERRLDAKTLKELTGFESFQDLSNAIIDGKIKLHKQEKVRPSFRLTPPSRGFKSIKEQYPRGDLGYRGKEINDLIERMV